MNKIIGFVCSLYMICCFFGCEDHRNDNLPDSVIYLTKTGLYQEELYKTGVDHICQIGVVQSGLLGATTPVKIDVSEKLMEEYNATNGTSFSLLPSNYYTFICQSSVLSEKQKRDFFQIEFKTEMIEKDGLKDCVLPLMLSAENNGIVNEATNRVLICPAIREAKVGLRMSGIQNFNFNPRSGKRVEIEIPVEAEFKNHWDIQFTLDMSKDLLDDWNSLNEGDLIMPPADCFWLEGTLEIKAGKTEKKLKLVIDRTKMPYGDFAIPVALTETSKFEINDERNFLLLKILNLQDKLDRSIWGLTPSSEQASNPINLMIDEDPATFWHSRYSPAPVPPMPYEILIDFGGLHEISAFDLLRRSDKFYNDLKSGSFEISEDGDEWEEVSVFEFPDINQKTPTLFFFGKRNARYGRILIDASNRGTNVSIAEFNVYGEKL